jgi:anti-sigma factor RsiW
MNCKQIQELLNAFIGGRLGADESLQVRMHLASCASCRSRLSATEWVEILPGLDESIEPSGEFASRFYAALEERRHARKERPGESGWNKRAAWGWPWSIAAAGVLAALIAVGIYISNYPSDSPENSAVYYDLEVTENLPLLRDMAVISNLDLLENLDAIENLPPLNKKTATN